jgi:hypothetical protein
MPRIILLLLVLAITIVVMMGTVPIMTGGGYFSSLEYDISDGNPESLSKIQNTGGRSWSALPELKHIITMKKSPFEPPTVQGYGVPLKYEFRRSYKGDKLHPASLHERQIRCHPGCCPSSNSCDSGCLCHGLMLGTHP